jgi:ACT domain-containing protein
MTPLEQAFKELLGEDPTPEAVQRLYRIKDILEFSEHDSIWSILLAFGHYESIYNKIPESILAKTRECLADHKLALDETAAAVERRVQGSLAERMSAIATELSTRMLTTANDLASAKARRRFSMGMLAGGIVAALVILLAIWTAFSIGRHAVDADSAWLQTRDGVAARKFAQMNSIPAMLDCPSEFVTRQEGDGIYCIPYETERKKNRGWRIK